MNFIAAALLVIVAGLIYALRHQSAIVHDLRYRLKNRTEEADYNYAQGDLARAEAEELRWQLEASNFMLETAINEANLGEDFRIPLPADHERKKRVESALADIEAIPETLEETEYTEVYSGCSSAPVAIFTSGSIPPQRDAGNGQAYFKRPA